MRWTSSQLLELIWGVPRCDDCIAAAFGVTPKRANKGVQRWVRRGSAVRERGRCPGCGVERLVTRAIPEKLTGPGRAD